MSTPRSHDVVLAADTAADDQHACDSGWIGFDYLRRAIPCPSCKPHLLRKGHPLPEPVMDWEPPIRRERRKDVPAKAARLLTSGAVTCELVIPDKVLARVQGDGGRYEVRRDRGRGWHCSCPARRGCSHCAAVALVVRGEKP